MSTLFYLEKGCASIEFPEKISKNADYVVRASGRGLEGRLFLRRLGQIDRPGLVFAELIEDGAQVADLVGQLIRAAELDLIAVVIPEGDVIFLFHVERADMFKQPRAVELAEHIERGGTGLNLTYEVRMGILGHTGDFIPETLEGQIVRTSDRIAYINHDIDDAMRAGILTEDDIPPEIAEILGHSHSQRINTLVENMIDNTIATGTLGMQPEIAQAMDRLRTFMFARVYTNPVAKGEEAKVENILRGIDFAVDEINKAGGVNGQMLEVVRGDHAGDAATGKSEAERLITQEGVNVIMGCHMSVVTEVVAQVCQQYGIPMITAISTLDRLTDEDHKDYDYFFRLCPLNSVYVEDMLKYLQDSKEQTGNEIKKVAIFTDKAAICLLYTSPSPRDRG